MSDSRIDGNTPQTVKKIAAQLQRVGWVCFWLQLVLAIVSAAIFIFAILMAGSSANNPATGGSLLFSLGGLVVLFGSTFWSFRYMQIARQLKNPDLRPKKADTIQTIRIGILLGTIGMGLSVIGAESISGTLLGKSFSSFSVSVGFFNADALSRIIQPLDISIVLANTHTITAHFIGILGSLFLLDRITKPGS
jgi:Protein of unknown function (DUF3611)